jgi:zona occludens toxin
MPINAYTGLMGSGKSYECVSSVIMQAIMKGRRVVTNVDGIHGDAIRAYIHEKKGIALELLGTVVHCKNDDVLKADFLPHGTDVDTFVKPGDIVCIDEAWRFWGSDSKIPKEHSIFFREHRHYVDPETKVSCDLVLMVQDISDLHRTLKVVVELSFRTTKIKSLGLVKRYRVEMWEGWKQHIKSRVKVEIKKYDPAIYPLYSSYDGGQGREVTVDDRQNILRNPVLWGLIAVFIVLGSASAWAVSKFFKGPQDKAKSEAKGSASLASSVPVGVPVAASAGPVSRPEFSDEWRVAGDIRIGAVRYVVLAAASGRIRYEHPSAFNNEGGAIVGTLDGRKVTVFSGAGAAESPQQGMVPMPLNNEVKK